MSLRSYESKYSWTDWVCLDPIIFGVINKGKCHDYHGISKIFQQGYQGQIKICLSEFTLGFALKVLIKFLIRVHIRVRIRIHIRVRNGILRSICIPFGIAIGIVWHGIWHSV